MAYFQKIGKHVKIETLPKTILGEKHKKTYISLYVNTFCFIQTLKMFMQFVRTLYTFITVIWCKHRTMWTDPKVTTNQTNESNLFFINWNGYYEDNYL